MAHLVEEVAQLQLQVVGAVAQLGHGDEDERRPVQEGELSVAGAQAAQRVLAVLHHRHQRLHDAEQRHQLLFVAVPAPTTVDQQHPRRFDSNGCSRLEQSLDTGVEVNYPFL